MALVLLVGTGATLTVGEGAEAASAGVAPACCEGHEAYAHCPMTASSGAATGGETSAPLLHGLGPSDAAMACCSPAPTGPSPAAVVPALPMHDVPVAVVAEWVARPRLAPVRSRTPDTGPLNPSLRAHLAFSVLLI